MPSSQMRTPLQITKAVVLALVLREFLGRFTKRRMGAVWTFVEPFLHVLVLTLFFTYIRGRHIAGIDYPIFLITALVPFFLYRNVATRLMDSIEANRGLFAYKQIKPIDTFVARALVETVLLTVVYLILLGLFGWAGFDVGIHEPIEWLAILLVGLVFSFALGVMLAIIVNVIPDLKFFVRMMFMPLYFISGIIYPPSRFPPEYLHLFLWNPFLHFSELTRSFVFSNYVPVKGVSAMFVIESTLITLFCALSLYWIRRVKLLAI